MTNHRLAVHAHWWLIGPCDLIPGQALDQGVCKLCGATRAFPVVVVDTPYEAWVKTGKGSPGTAEQEIAGYMAEQMESER